MIFKFKEKKRKDKFSSYNPNIFSQIKPKRFIEALSMIRRAVLIPFKMGLEIRKNS